MRTIKTGVGIICVLFLCLNISLLQGKSVPLNIGMEKCDWVFQGEEFSWDNQEKHTGEYSMKIENSNPSKSLSWRSKLIPVKPDTHYRITGWMKYKDIVPNPGNGLGVAVTYLNLRDAEGKSLNVNPKWWGVGTSDGWVKQELVFKTGADTVNLAVTPKMVRAAGQVWFDGISLEEMDSGISFVVEKGEYKGLTARCSSVMGENSPARAFDGDASTIWVSSEIPCWVQIDLGEEKEIGQIIWNGDRGKGYNNRIPENYRFTISSTGDFSGEQKAVAGAEGNRNNKNVTHRFDPVKTRYVRMEIYTTYGANKEPSIDAIKILPPPFQD